MLELAGAIAGLVGYGAAVAHMAYDAGVRRGREQANEVEYDKGWDRGYDSGWEQCRNRAIEYGVGSL